MHTGAAERHGGEGPGRIDPGREGWARVSTPKSEETATVGLAGQGQGSQCLPLPGLQMSPTLTTPLPVPAAHTKALA